MKFLALGRLMLVSLVHSRKAMEFMVVALGRLMLVREVPWNAWFPMLVAFGRLMLVRFEQLTKAKSFMTVALGRLMLVREVHLSKAAVFMLVACAK